MKTASKGLVFGLLISVALSLSSTCFALGLNTKNDNSSCDFMKLSSIVGTVSLSLGSDEVMTKTMPCLLSLWQNGRNRGSGDFYMSNAFLAVMEENPAAFFAAMVNEPKIFSEWLSDLPDTSFTWSGEPPCGVETKRKQLISILQHSRIQEPKQLALKNAVLKRLSTIRCRQID